MARQNHPQVWQQPAKRQAGGAWAGSRPGARPTAAEALGHAGNAAEGLSTIEEALRLAADSDEYWCTAELLRIKAELTLKDGGGAALRAAEALFLESLGWARRQAALSWELRTALGLARLLRRQGRPDEARSLLAPVCRRFTEGFATADLLAARACLAECASAGRKAVPFG